jgi:hypothetical protein
MEDPIERIAFVVKGLADKKRVCSNKLPDCSYIVTR